MSRSYRKAYSTQGYERPRSHKFWKKEGNRRVHNTKEDIPNGQAYRKILDPWISDDFSYYQSPKDILRYYPEWWRLTRK